MKEIQINKNPFANQNIMRLDKSDPNLKLTVKVHFQGG